MHGGPYDWASFPRPIRTLDEKRRGAQGTICSPGLDRRAALVFVPGGLLIVAAALSDRRSGATESHELLEHRLGRFHRGGLVMIGVAWALTGAVVGIEAL